MAVEGLPRWEGPELPLKSPSRAELATKAAERFARKGMHAVTTIEKMLASPPPKFLGYARLQADTPIRPAIISRRCNASLRLNHGSRQTETFWRIQGMLAVEVATWSP
jgi:hypothetical protein